MNALANRLNVDEERMVGQELERLFNLQDCPLKADKKAAFVYELSMSGYPCKAIISGIQDLAEKDLSKIKLFTITEAIRSKITYRDDFQDCRYCGLSGFVSMADDKGYIFAIPCTCPRGEMYSKKQKLNQWNGSAVQESHGRVLRLLEPGILRNR